MSSLSPQQRLATAGGITLALVVLKPWINIPAFIKAFLTSEERAIKYYRTQAIEAAAGAAAIFGTGVAIYEFPTLLPKIFAFFQKWFPNLIAQYLKWKNITPRDGFIAALFTFAGRFLLRKGWNYMWTMWKQHITYNPPQPGAPPFMREQVKVQNGKFMPQGVTVDFVINRSMSYYGMTKLAYLFTQFTVGLEYPFNVIYRVFCRYAQIGRYAVSITTPENFYTGVMNTSMACWMRPDGNLEYHNLCLNFNTESILHIKKIVIELDHDRKIFTRMLKDDVPITDSEQAAIIAMNIFAIYTHPHVHWYANGATQMVGEWKLAQTSSNITQWMNNAATYKSWYFIGDSAAVMATIIYNNLNQGLPVHNDIPPKWAKQSISHMINREARIELLKMYPHWDDGRVDAVLSSTVLHSADHFYTDKYMSFASQSSVLRHDFSYIRVALFGPNTYRTRRLLCRQRQDDPVAKVIYQIAAKHDKSFADYGLFFGCAN